MTTPVGPPSVRARGNRRLAQITAGMVVVGVGGVTAVAIHDAQPRPRLDRDEYVDRHVNVEWHVVERRDNVRLIGARRLQLGRRQRRGARDDLRWVVMATIVSPLRRPVAADWEALGCAVHVVVGDPADLDAARAAVTAELAAIDLACSRFRPDSELMRLDERAGAPVGVSPLLAEALAAALRAAEVTDGDVDPTVGAAMVAAGYDRDFAQLSVGGPAVTVVRRPVPGWRRISLDQTGLVVTVPSNVVLDLGATAKALAADRAARKAAEGIDGHPVLVALGGDAALGGEPPGDGWSIRVQDVTGPLGAPPSGPSQVIALRAGGLATSSTAARRWVRGGHVMHHILDPRNGVPVVSPWRTVSVAAPSCLDANIYSTAAIVRGTAALDWLRGRGLAARLVDTSGVVTVLPGWPQPGSPAR